ncbi:MAG: hypothetical protein MJ100_08020 [Ruminococcus sp.]|nr:hypothetical protein [Ruminococcus sp.]
MDMKIIFKGAAAGAAAGIAVYAFASAAPSKKMSIRRDAGKTAKAAAHLIDDVKSLIM